MKWKYILIAIILGMIYPSILFSLCRSTEKAKVESAPEPIVVTTTVLEKEVKNVSVMDLNGNIQVMDMGDYLTCVLLCEMPTSFDIEALKAQAVVARTYTLRRENVATKHYGASVCLDSGCCQGYLSEEEYLSSGGDAEDIEKVHLAVSETEGEVLLYNEQLIDATYFSCSGGRTEDAVAVWGTDVPYLQSTISEGEEKAAHYVDTITYTVSEFFNKLNLSQNNNAITISHITYTEGGGVDSIWICDTEYSGVTIRKLLGLPSTVFAITVLGDSVIITTRGFGHRVGMSQYGAEAMAVSGKSYEEILKHYYKDVVLSAYSG